ncbi:hypothetical protein NP493_920g00108 [Ridgeia piscesae]|uniref:Uncharacterized protein n=1 Tax=Ridgeia piscesae TaxID=27915 RepID=A0AAD9KM13_RIDPI|nr:hypothetical protein NP493_920g00108 [Ridgeia piscesae]
MHVTILAQTCGHLCTVICVHKTITFCVTAVQGFMQDQIIASHTCFGGPMDVNFYKFLNVSV